MKQKTDAWTRWEESEKEFPCILIDDEGEFDPHCHSPLFTEEVIRQVAEHWGYTSVVRGRSFVPATKMGEVVGYFDEYICVLGDEPDESVDLPFEKFLDGNLRDLCYFPTVTPNFLVSANREDVVHKPTPEPDWDKAIEEIIRKRNNPTP